MVLAQRIVHGDILMGGRYEFGVGRGHGWIPWRAGIAYSEMVERYDEHLPLLPGAHDAVTRIAAQCNPVSLSAVEIRSGSAPGSITNASPAPERLTR